MLRDRLYVLIHSLMRRQYALGERELARKTRLFMKRTLAAMAAGCLLIFVLLALDLRSRYVEDRSPVRVTRNDFGQGDSRKEVILQAGKEQETYGIQLAEKDPGSQEIEQQVKEMFGKLDRILPGKNPSLKEVREDLCFPEKIEGCPFTLSYESEDPDYVRFDGTLGASAGSLTEEERHPVKIRVSAVYGKIHKERTYDLILAARNKETDTVYSETEEMIRSMEADSRGKSSFLLPAEYRGIKIRERKDRSFSYVLFLFFIVLLLPVFFIEQLRNRAQECQKETRKDFSTIVNLLALFMGAGVSFPTAVRRICEDYRRRKKQKGERYAFEKMLAMEQQLDAGVSQKDACRSWGSQFDSSMYRKLTAILIQGFSKGAKESRRLLDLAEEEAFRQRVDQARKEGEEAATKLLFPMVVLLGVVMVLVMFPALVRFQSY